MASGGRFGKKPGRLSSLAIGKQCFREEGSDTAANLSARLGDAQQPFCAASTRFGVVTEADLLVAWPARNGGSANVADESELCPDAIVARWSRSTSPKAWHRRACEAFPSGHANRQFLRMQRRRKVGELLPLLQGQLEHRRRNNQRIHFMLNNAAFHESQPLHECVPKKTD